VGPGAAGPKNKNLENWPCQPPPGHYNGSVGGNGRVANNAGCNMVQQGWVAVAVAGTVENLVGNYPTALEAVRALEASGAADGFVCRAGAEEAQYVLDGGVLHSIDD
jgi:hypothetical protein